MKDEGLQIYVFAINVLDDEPVCPEEWGSFAVDSSVENPQEWFQQTQNTNSLLSSLPALKP